MSPTLFNFPPESYSAVYTNDVTSANVVNSKPANTADGQLSPVSNVNASSASLFSCFHCAFRKSINVIRKEKHAKKSKGLGFNAYYVPNHWPYECFVEWEFGLMAEEFWGKELVTSVEALIAR